MLEQIEQHETIDVRQSKVEGNRVGPQLADHREGAGTGGRNHPLQSPAHGPSRERSWRGRIVLDDQHERVLAKTVTVVCCGGIADQARRLSGCSRNGQSW